MFKTFGIARQMVYKAFINSEIITNSYLIKATLYDFLTLK